MKFIDSIGMEIGSLSTYERAVDGQFAYPGFLRNEYMNFGFWNRDTEDRNEASEELLRRLVVPMENRDAYVLDVACGAGFTTRFLSSRWTPERVHGIDVSETLIARCRERHPNCRFSVMNAMALDFDDQTFDYVVCVEAAMHFSSREGFFEETARVLKHGGMLALTDFTDSLDAYRALLLSSGFSEVTVKDITANGPSAYLDYMHRKLRRDRESGLIRNKDEYEDASKFLSFLADSRQSNVMAFAHKR